MAARKSPRHRLQDPLKSLKALEVGDLAPASRIIPRSSGLKPVHGHPRPAAAHATTLNIKGESYRLKEKRRAGLLARQPTPTPGEEAATAD